MASVRPPDLELFLTGAVRAWREAQGLAPFDHVGNAEPNDGSAPFPDTAVIVRDDGGPQLERITFDRSVGFSVLAGTKVLDQEANDLARDLYGFATSEEIVRMPGSPIAAVVFDGCVGPYPVDEAQDRARRYFAVQYVVIGTWA